VFFEWSVPKSYLEEIWRYGQSSSGVPSEELVESCGLKGRLRRWRCKFRCGVLTSGKLRNLHYVKSVARRRLVETVIN
jgi:hypothetical protein